MAINNVVLMGRLTADPEVRQTQNGKSVCTFSVAVDRNYTDDNGDRECDFIRCVAWNGSADFIGKWFNKGSMIALTGKLMTSTYEDDKGSMHYPTDVIVESISFTGEKRDNDNGNKPDNGRSNKSGARSGRSSRR